MPDSGLRGDPSEQFDFASFFPDRLQPAVGMIAFQCHKLFRVAAWTPQSNSVATGADDEGSVESNSVEATRRRYALFVTGWRDWQKKNLCTICWSLFRTMDSNGSCTAFCVAENGVWKLWKNVLAQSKQSRHRNRMWLQQSWSMQKAMQKATQM